MNNAKQKDKTSLLQAFERELRASSLVAGNVANTLKEAEAELRPYFEHPDILPAVIKTGAMTYESSFLRTKRHEPWVASGVRAIISDFKKAEVRDNKLCFDAWTDWVRSTDQAIANIATAALLELRTERTDLEPHILVKSIFRVLAEILEGSLKQFATLRLQMCEIAGLRKHSQKPVEKLSFGEVLDGLIVIGKDGEMYRPTPFSIAASQWRNIASHNGYETKGELVYCSYGPINKQKHFCCSPEDILNIARYFNDLCFVHKVAIEIWAVDNSSSWSIASPQIAVSEYTKDGALAFGLVSAGFIICYATQRGTKWRLALKDEHLRDKGTTKVALQEAVLSYAMLNSGVEIQASVYSKHVTHRFGFVASFPK